MTDLTREQIEALLDGATPGKRVQFHGSYCKEAAGTPFTEWDSSHDMSVIRPDGSRYRLAHYKHAMDAYLSQMAPDLARQLLATMTALAEAQKREAGLREALNLADDALTEAEAILGGEYGDHYGPLCETMLDLQGRIAALSAAPTGEESNG